MTYGGFLLRHPLFWALLTGLALGVAIAAATSRPARSRRPFRAAARKWTLTWVALSFAVLAAAAGMIVPPDLEIIRSSSVWPLGIGLLVGTFGLRLPRSAGLPLLVMIGIAAILGGSLVRGYVPVRDEMPIAEITVLSVREADMTVEATVSTPSALGVPEIATMPGASLRVEVDLLDLPDAFFLLGAVRFVRYAGPGIADVPPAAADGRTATDGQTATDRWVAAVTDFLLERIVRLPGTRSGPVVTEVSSVNLLRTYLLVVSPDEPPRLVIR